MLYLWLLQQHCILHPSGALLAAAACWWAEWIRFVQLLRGPAVWCFQPDEAPLYSSPAGWQVLVYSSQVLHAICWSPIDAMLLELSDIYVACKCWMAPLVMHACCLACQKQQQAMQHGWWRCHVLLS